MIEMPTDANPVTVIEGDCLDVLRQLPDGCVQCCVTSPPYFGLRDYGHAGQIGLEPTPDEYVAKMVRVFREVRRVLRDDGTLWLNLGDSYAAHKGQRKVTDKFGAKQNTNKGSVGAPSRHVDGLPAKNLIGIPWRVAFALQADGWYLRQDIIWHKPNPMPESVTDRCTKAHEYIFLLAKSERYWFDGDAVAEKSVDPESHRGRNPRNADKFASADPDGFARTRKGFAKLEGKTYPTRNRRSVWTVSTKPFKGAHFAVMPPDLVEPCIKAGCPVDGIVLDPFGGSGTVGMVAASLGRRAVLIELNPTYIDICRNRIASVTGMGEGSLLKSLLLPRE